VLALIVVSLLADQPAAPPAAAASAPASAAPAATDVAGLLAQADEAWPARDEPGRLDAIQSALDRALQAAPDDYGVLWRQSRLYFWRSDDQALPDADKSRLGKKGWDFGDRATRVNPGGVEGWNYAASGVGNYSLGIGVVEALFKGIEGDFTSRLKKAEELDPRYDSGGIATAWGRYYYELPWPKHSAKKCQQWLEKALEQNPDNVRALVYLGDLHLDEGRKAEARAAWERALAKPPGIYDGPEERRWQGQARARLEKLGK